MGAYAEAGVNYANIKPFKRAMVECGKRTLAFPNPRGVFILEHLRNAHGAAYEYRGHDRPIFVKTTEGLGNKNWIVEWMYMQSDTGQTYHNGIGIDALRMASNDALAHGGMPVVYTDEVAVGSDKWFTDEKRSRDVAESFFQACKEDGIALPAGESPALKYLMKCEPPVESAPSFSGAITSIVSPSDRLITGENLKPGLVIIGVKSSGLHANGISLVIKEALKLPDAFLTRLPNGNTLGEEALIPTRSYLKLIEAILDAGIRIPALLPGTGGGVAKLASDTREITYRIHTWLPEDDIPILFRFLLETCNVSLFDCLTTFNWGIGYYIFAHPSDAPRIMEIGTEQGEELIELGRTEEGKRHTIFEPARITLPPPDE